MRRTNSLIFQQRYGSWAVVTGASSGIGRALAEELAAAGINLVLIARRENELRALAERMVAHHQIQARWIACDLSDIAAVSRVMAETDPLEVGLLVAAAGFGTSGEFVKSQLEDELGMLDVNCRAATALAFHFNKRFVAQGRGGLILFGSLVGFQGTPFAAHYAATKAYMQTLAEGLYLELKPKGVDVLAVAPGPVNSGFADRARMVMGAADKPETVARATIKALGKGMTVTPGPVGKLLTYSLMTAPRSLRTRIMGRIMGSMTKPQNQQPEPATSLEESHAKK